MTHRTTCVVSTFRRTCRRLQAQLSDSPTITSPALMTAGGMMLGTAAYVSPERAHGKLGPGEYPLTTYAIVMPFGNTQNGGRRPSGRTAGASSRTSSCRPGRCVATARNCSRMVEDFVDRPNNDCYSVDPQPIGCDKEARRWMHTSRRSGAEGFFFTQKRASLTPANTRRPRASPPAPALPVPRLPDSFPAPAETGQRPASKTGGRKSDQGA
jgi:hypothetical protein